MSAGFLWCYAGESDKLVDKFVAIVEIVPLPPASSSRAIKVAQYSRDGKLITIHESLGKAAKSIENGHHSGITECCKGKSILHKGFIWRYA
jgi:hypothetical protein